MPLINCEISIRWKWSRSCIIVAGAGNNQNPSFQINDTKRYFPVVTSSTQEIIKPLKQLESGFKRNINQKIDIQPKQQIENGTDVRIN